jgi:hypothetical protein
MSDDEGEGQPPERTNRDLVAEIAGSLNAVFGNGAIEVAERQEALSDTSGPASASWSLIVAVLRQLATSPA